MPIPKPNENETQDEFLERCMGNDVMNEEYPERDQRYAICNSQWRKRNMNKEFKTLLFEVKVADEEKGIFEGYAATFSDKPDSYGDIIDPGAFAKTLEENGKRIKILWQHDTKEPIGKPLEIREDERGLWIKGKLSLGVQRAREVLNLMKDGVLTELSFGYDSIKESFKGGTRYLKEIKLWDISPVVFAANPEAIIASVKEQKQGNIDALIDSWDSWAGSFTQCVSILSGKPGITDPEALCAWMHHEAEGTWPGEKEAQKAVERAKIFFKSDKSGRVLSAASLDKVRGALEALQALLESAEKEPEPGKSTPLSITDKEAAELEGTLGGIEADLIHFDIKAAEARIDQILEKITEVK